MKSDSGTLVELFAIFAVLSFFAIGGASTTLPEMHLRTVDTAHWLTDRQFSELFAIAQAAPGPNVMFVALLGQFIAGAPGAVVATVAMCGPTCVLAYLVSLVFERFRESPWCRAVKAGLVPVTVGLVAASALVIVQSADKDVHALVITAATFALVYWTRISPLFGFAGAALLGLAGFV
jgi:chromate transporter